MAKKADSTAKPSSFAVPPIGGAFGKSSDKKSSKSAEKPKPFKLTDCDPSAKPYSSGDKAKDVATTQALADELDALQDLFYADKRFKLLLVLQGTDTSGKDGTVRGVFNRTARWVCTPSAGKRRLKKSGHTTFCGAFIKRCQAQAR